MHALAEAKFVAYHRHSLLCHKSAAAAACVCGAKLNTNHQATPAYINDRVPAQIASVENIPIDLDASLYAQNK